MNNNSLNCTYRIYITCKHSFSIKNMRYFIKHLFLIIVNCTLLSRYRVEIYIFYFACLYVLFLAIHTKTI